jgi:spoIIIJ-associated protein
MNGKHASLEVIAPSIEEAVAKGLAELGLSENDVDVEVLDQGTRGLFGLGSRQARVRLVVKGEPPRSGQKIETAAQAAPAEAPLQPVEAPAPVSPPPPASHPPAAPVESAPAELSEEQEEILDVARSTVLELLEKMRVDAEVAAKFGVPDDERSQTPILVDVRGDDLSILIGRQAETLNALQYITSLIVSKQLGHAVTLVLDVQGYRKRREGQIRQLARRMADQAVKTGRRQVLEPMPASERRLVHLELRDNPQVMTESIGEEPHRKVTIVPKE